MCYFQSDFDKTPERKPVRNMEMSPVFTNFSGKKRRGSHSSDGEYFNAL